MSSIWAHLLQVMYQFQQWNVVRHYCLDLKEAVALLRYSKSLADLVEYGRYLMDLSTVGCQY